MRKRFMEKIVLVGIFGIIAISRSAGASCVTAPECESLGYTKRASECTSGGVKCPWDNSKYYCGGTTCESIGKKTCTGDICAPAGGCCSDADCGSGNACKNNNCSRLCVVGDFFYSDFSCSATLTANKTPIGVVIAIKNKGKNGTILSLKDKVSLPWGCPTLDIDSLTNFAIFSPDQRTLLSEGPAQNDLNGAHNTLQITTYCPESQVSGSGQGSTTAAGYCNDYSIDGVSGWYLPAYGELYPVIKTNFMTFFYVFKQAGGDYLSSYSYWTSSESNKERALSISRYGEWRNAAYAKGQYGSMLVRCALAF